MPLTNLIRNLETLNQQLTAGLDATFNEDLQVVAQLERERLERGEDAEGNRLERKDGSVYPYSKQYSKSKKAKGGRVDVINLKVNGDYHTGITAQKTGKLRADIYSRDYKNKFLANQYNNVHGMSPKDTKIFSQYMVPKIIRITKSIITNKK